MQQARDGRTCQKVLLMLNLRPQRNRLSEIEWSWPALVARSGRQVVALRRCMSNEQEESRNMTADECDEFAAALVEDAAALPHGPKKEDLLRLAESYSNLAEMKRMVLRKSN
jgi:hypothetical protein